MPLTNYDRFYGSKPGAARETLAAMIQRYGKKRGTAIFYALANDRKKKLSGQIMGRR